MKSKTSLFNKAVFKHNLSAYWVLGAGLLLWHLCVVTLLVYAAVKNDIFYKEDLAAQRISALSAANASGISGIFAVFAVAIAMFMFSYLFTARNSNMLHTFPLNRKSLFVTNYVTGILFLVVPYAISMLFTKLFCMSKGISTDGYFAWIFLFAVGETFFFYNMAVCVIMFVGNIVAVPVIYLILNFLYYCCRMIVSLVIISVSYGVSSNVLSGINHPLTPITYMNNLNMGLMLEGGHDNLKIVVNGKNALLYYTLAAAVFGIIAFIAYQKKQIETAGDVITVGWLKPVFRWGAAFGSAVIGSTLIHQLFFDYIGYFGIRKAFLIIITALTIGCIAFFVAQMLLDKSLRVFNKKRFQEYGIFAVCIIVLYIAVDADWFGMEKYVPDASEVRIATIGNNYTVSVNTEEEIAEICALHQQMADARKELEKYENRMYQERNEHPESIDGWGYVWVSIQYTMKNGSVVSRQYHIPNALEYKENPDSLYNKLMAYMNAGRSILNNLFGSQYDSIEITGGSIERNWRNGSGDEENGDSVIGFIDRAQFSQKDAQLIYEALVRDVDAGYLQQSGEFSENLTYKDLYQNTLTLAFSTNAASDDLDYHIVVERYDGSTVYAYREIEFNKYCTNLIDTLIQLGYISSEDELITYEY